MSEYPINTYEQVGAGGVYVTYVPPQPRSVMAACTRVVRVGFKTDPNGAWYDYGHKSFVGKMKESVPAAKAWAERRYGIKRWKRNGMGDWVDADAGYKPLERQVEAKAARSNVLAKNLGSEV